MQFVKKLLFLLTPKEQKSAMLLLFLTLMMAVIDTIGVASILPFITVLSNPDLVETNFFLKSTFKALKIFGVENNNQFLFVLGLIVFLTLIFSLTFKAITTYAQIRFINMRQYSIGKRLIEGYLNQPYSWFLSRNSSDVGKNILSEVTHLVSNGLNPLIDLIAKSLVAISIVVLLIFFNPKLAFIVSIALSGVYGIIFYLIRRYLNQIGEKRLKNNNLRFMAIKEAFGAIKDVKVGGLEKIFIKQFSDSAKTYAQTESSALIIGQLPSFILEAIAFGGMLLIVLFMMSETGNFNNVLPILSLYAFAGYRLMPALQRIYRSFTQLSFINYSLNKLYVDLKNIKPLNLNEDNRVLSLKKSIELKNINYNYPNTSRTALKNINLSIPSKSTIGLVGATGSGKTTLVDIILRLLEPQRGTLEVDGYTIVKKNTRAWQRNIGYVPQNIFLIDNSVAANIAYGVDPKNIEQKTVEKVSKIANLHEFVENELPERYQTIIGENGVRLSGGQRQRIGIARALYHNPKILIMDEATSALDNQTEKAVMSAVTNFDKDITLILIAHRLSTVKKCDHIFFLKNGELEAEGTFDELIKSNKSFSDMAMISR